jgi:hypothetical protein
MDRCRDNIIKRQEKNSRIVERRKSWNMSETVYLRRGRR